MSKKLEEAYKEYTQAQIPDLWDRIEAGLPEKKIEGVAGNISQHSGHSEGRKKSKVLHKRLYAGIAAAASLCLLFAGSGIYRTLEKKGADQMTASEQNVGFVADDAMTESAETEGTIFMEESEAVTEESVTEESVTEEEAVREESMAEDTTANMTESVDSQETLKEESEAESATELEAERTEEVLNDTAQSGQESEKEFEETMTEGKSYDVTVTITDMENTGEEILYYAVIVSAVERPVEVDGKVSFCISEDEFAPFEIGKTYSLRLTQRPMQGTEIQPYLVTQMYGAQ